MKTHYMTRNERIATLLFKILMALIFGAATIITSIVFSPVVVFGFLKKNWQFVAPVLFVLLIAILTISAMIVLPILRTQP